MTQDAITWLEIDALRTAIEKGSLSAAQVADHFLARIAELDPKLQAYSVVYEHRARATAVRLDAAQAKGEPLGPLHGVAVALKDLCDVAGEPTRAGTTALGDVPAAEDAEVVRRLESAGAIVLGKVKMTEGAFVEHHLSVIPPVNPWNAQRWTGISSSGSGVAVAAGLCTIALGTDTGGSIRYPSSACGLSGLKPTHGRVSLRGVYPLVDSLDHIGPMGRSVADVSVAFSVLCGHDPRDAWSLAENPKPAPLPAAPSMRGKRLGYDARFCDEGIDPEIREVFEVNLEVLSSLGAEIVEFEIPPFEETLASWLLLGSAEIANAHAETYPSKKEEYGEGLAGSIELGRTVTGQDVAKAWRTRISFSRRLEACFSAGESEGQYALDGIVAPVSVGRFPANANLGDPSSLPFGAAAMRFTSPFNLSGSPSLTLCGGFDAEGAPIGFQIVGRHRDEAGLLEIGAAYQAATDHHKARPDSV